MSDEAKCTATMTAVGLSWGGVSEVVQHCVNLLRDKGDSVLELVESTLRLVKLATLRDMFGIFDELRKDKVVIDDLIAAIKAEFGL